MAKPAKKKDQRLDRDHQAYVGICQMLFNNDLAPGQKIGYSDLANRLGVSITPVIHALKWLEFKGVVRHEPNRGYFINQISLKEVREIYETRLLLEVHLAGLAVKTAGPEDIRRLAGVLREFDAAVEAGNFQRRMMIDMRVHMTLASLAGRDIQLRLLQDLFDRLLLQYSQSLVFVSMMDTSSRDHWNMHSALQAGDGPALQAVVTSHLSNTRDQILKGLPGLINTKSEKFSEYVSLRGQP